MSAQTAQSEPANQRPRRRLRIVAFAVAVAAAGTVPLIAHGTGANAAAHALAGSGQLHRLEAQGYVPEACTRRGTLMVDPKTGRRVTVKAA